MEKKVFEASGYIDGFEPNQFTKLPNMKQYDELINAERNLLVYFIDEENGQRQALIIPKSIAKGLIETTTKRNFVMDNGTHMLVRYTPTPEGSLLMTHIGKITNSLKNERNERLAKFNTDEGLITTSKTNELVDDDQDESSEFKTESIPSKEGNSYKEPEISSFIFLNDLVVVSGEYVVELEAGPKNSELKLKDSVESETIVDSENIEQPETQNDESIQLTQNPSSNLVTINNQNDNHGLGKLGLGYANLNEVSPSDELDDKNSNEEIIKRSYDELLDQNLSTSKNGSTEVFIAPLNKIHELEDWGDFQRKNNAHMRNKINDVIGRNFKRNFLQFTQRYSYLPGDLDKTTQKKQKIAEQKELEKSESERLF